jgi:hypothetical protein
MQSGFVRQPCMSHERARWADLVSEEIELLDWHVPPSRPWSSNESRKLVEANRSTGRISSNFDDRFVRRRRRAVRGIRWLQAGSLCGPDDGYEILLLPVITREIAGALGVGLGSLGEERFE